VRLSKANRRRDFGLVEADVAAGISQWRPFKLRTYAWKVPIHADRSSAGLKRAFSSQRSLYLWRKPRGKDRT